MSTNEGRFSGKVALITGASRGMGAEIAKKLAAGGAEFVGVHYATNRDAALKVVEITLKLLTFLFKQPARIYGMMGGSLTFQRALLEWPVQHVLFMRLPKEPLRHLPWPWLPFLQQKVLRLMHFYIRHPAVFT